MNKNTMIKKFVSSYDILGSTVVESVFTNQTLSWLYARHIQTRQ